MRASELLRSFIDVVSEAKPYAGTADSQRLQARNSDIKNVNLIRVGQQIMIPGGGLYTVKPGDTMDKISRRFGPMSSPQSAVTDPKLQSPADIISRSLGTKTPNEPVTTTTTTTTEKPPKESPEQRAERRRRERAELLQRAIDSYTKPEDTLTPDQEATQRLLAQQKAAADELAQYNRDHVFNVDDFYNRLNNPRLKDLDPDFDPNSEMDQYMDQWYQDKIKGK